MQKKDETATKISPSLYCKAGPRQREKCIPPGWPRECSSASPTRTADGPDLEPIGSAASILPARQAFVAAYAANASRTRPDRGSCSLQHPAAERGDDRAAIATYEAQLPATTHRRQDAWPSRHLALSVPTPHNLFFPLHASPLTTPRSNLQHQLLVHIHGSRQWLGVIPLIHIHGSSTVRHRGMGSGISEASKRVPIFSFDTQGGKQVSSYFRQRNWVQARAAGWLELDSIE